MTNIVVSPPYQKGRKEIMKRYYEVERAIYIYSSFGEIILNRKGNPCGQIIIGDPWNLMDPQKWGLLLMPEDPDGVLLHWIEEYTNAFIALSNGDESKRKEVQKYQRDIRRGFCILR